MPSRPHGEPEVLLVYKKSKLALYVHERKNERYRRLLLDGARVTEQFQAAHDAHLSSLERVKQALRERGVRFRTCYRARLKEEATAGRVVVTVGGDGTVLDASHKVTAARLLGVNSDPARSVGFLCAASAETFGAVLDDLLAGRLVASEVARLGGAIDGTPLPFPVLNEVLLTHKNPAATTRYTVEHGGVSETHKSSGVWISGPAGSTAAIGSAGGEKVPLSDARAQVWVREPYGLTAPLRKARLFLAPDDEIRFTSQMREGVLYLDGPHQRVPFPVGATLTVHARGAPLSLVVTPEMEARRAAAT